MATGIIYCMTTIVPGLVSIGKTSAQNFQQRMSDLEQNGYCNVAGLRRAFAIEVDGYVEKTNLLYEIFSQQRLETTELFSVDIQIIIRLLSAFQGAIVFPSSNVTTAGSPNAANVQTACVIPDGTYTLNRNKKNGISVRAIAVVKNGHWTLKKHSIIDASLTSEKLGSIKSVRDHLPVDERGKLIYDVDLGECTPSMAGAVVLNSTCNGWTEWKNSEGESVDVYRRKEETSKA